MLHNPASKKCLLAITGAFDLGGGIAAANRLILHALSEAGYMLRLIALSEPPQARFRYARFPHLHYSGLSGRKVQFAFAVWRAALSKRYALIFCDHVNLASILSPLAVLGLIQYRVRLNGIEVFHPLPDLEGKLGLRSARQRLAISEYTQARVQERNPRLDIEVCDLALSPEQSAKGAGVNDTHQAMDISLPAVDNSVQCLGVNVILHVGRMASAEQYKGQDILIQAMPRILAECPQAQLVLVGEGDDTERLKQLAHAQQPSVQPAIFMPGYVPDDMLNDLYRGCYLFAMPSWGEGFGLVYIEAMRWGKPCIGSRLDAARCIIREGETGLLVDDPRSPEQVTEKIVHLLKQGDTARAMGQAGYQRAQDYYLFPHFKERFLKAVGLSK